MMINTLFNLRLKPATTCSSEFDLEQEQAVDEKTFIKSVGKAIARQRYSRGLTQQQVADDLGIEKTTLSRLETGSNAPTLSRLWQLSKLFECDVRDFMGEVSGEEHAQADVIAGIIGVLPEEKRESVLRIVREATRFLR